MRQETLRFAPGIVVLLLLVSPVFPKSYQASRYDVTLSLQTGGDLLITETVQFRFKGGPFTYVFRDVPVAESDGLDSFQGFMDDRELHIGAGEVPGLEMEQRGSSVRATWHFAETSDSSHTFVVRYRARHAVRRERGQDLLLWKALPTQHPYRIESARVSVVCPAGVRPSGQPTANREATVTTSGEIIVYERGELGNDAGFTVNVPFAQGSILAQPPEWQQEAERHSAELKEAVLIAAAVEAPILLVGILLIVRLRHARSIPRGAAPTVVTSPPDDLPPFLVGAVRGSWSDWRVALATLIDLGQRGFLEIEAQPKRWWTTREFIVRRKRDPGELRQVERVLLRLVFGSDQPYAGEIRMSKVQRQLFRRWRQFTRALRDEAHAAGFVDADREGTRRKWIATGGVLMFLALVGTGSALFAFVPQGKYLPIAVAAGMGLGFFTLGLFVMVLGSTLTRLTDAALNRKPAWDAFRKYLKDLVSHKTGLQAEWLSPYLPYAIVLGLGNQWARAFKDRAIPAQFAWLVGIEQFDGSEIAALIAVLHSSGAGSSSAGGGGAGGGGGASGAG